MKMGTSVVSHYIDKIFEDAKMAVSDGPFTSILQRGLLCVYLFAHGRIQRGGEAVCTPIRHPSGKSQVVRGFLRSSGVDLPRGSIGLLWTAVGTLGSTCFSKEVCTALCVILR